MLNSDCGEHLMIDAVLTLRVPRPTENAALFLLATPCGEFRVLCHSFPDGLTCWNSLPAVEAAQAYRQEVAQ